MKLVFLGSLYPLNTYSVFIQKSKYVDFAGNALQWNLLEGFNNSNIDISVITVPSVKKYKGVIVKKYQFSHNNKSADYSVGFLDIFPINKIISTFKVYKLLRENHNNLNVLFIYSIQPHLYLASYLFKLKYPKVKIVNLITDLPEFMNSTSNPFYIILKNIERYIDMKFITKFNAFVLLSEYMKERLPINNKPYVVVEGIYNINDEVDFIRENVEIKQIMYSGTLAKSYGIMNLVHAFSKIKNDNYRLVICGDGDSKEEIIEFSKKDSRIQYLGSLKREEVLKLQKQSSLLVNPRTPEGEFTKYSFPSKTMEYLASGTPTLLYKLPGIPDEYYNYCYNIEKLGINELSIKIEEILNKSDEELKEIGNQARDFILKNKNPKVQCEKIINMINLLQNDNI